MVMSWEGRQILRLKVKERNGGQRGHGRNGLRKSVNVGLRMGDVL